VSDTPVVGLEHAEIIRGGRSREGDICFFFSNTFSYSLTGTIGRVPKHCHIDGGDIETKKRSDDPNKGGDVDTFIIQLGLEL
jgi:hypothetical protein